MPLENFVCNMFGGENAEPLNALMSALFTASGGRDNEHVYKFVEETPKTSFIVELHQALTKCGYKIVKI